MAAKRVYYFGDGTADGDASMKNLLGGKGANLAEMNRIGIMVPAGFTITTEVCTEYYRLGRKMPGDLNDEVEAALAKVEKSMGAKFGDPANPLLVSVRSGARASMPGMMDTVLNLGLNDTTVQGIINKTGNPRFAYDSYRRFVQMFSGVVLGVDGEHFEHHIDKVKSARKVKLDTDLSADDWKEMVSAFKAIVKKQTGKDFPDEPRAQLWAAIGAVFSSWMKPSAITYRKLHDIPADWGTAVNVQSMVYGNMGDDSATGVAFTRDPSTGDHRFYGEFLINAQGEDVVAGIRTPQQITKVGKDLQGSTLPAMEEVMPDLYRQLCDAYKKLENHYRDMQDLEFTIQQNKLWLLQTRTGKRTAKAALKIAVEMELEGMITKEEAVARVDASALDQLLHPTLDPAAKKKANKMAVGLAASPGAATGMAVFTADDAEAWANNGKKVILVREETSPEDIHGMSAAQGILTARGGMTSHAAVVARGMGKPCVSGCGEIKISGKKFTAKGTTIKEGDWITLDGSTGEVIEGQIATLPAELTGEFGTFMKWADEIRTMKVRTNADTPADAAQAIKYGAEGIGLCRTEHMFFEGERIIAVREMILASDEAGRRKALAKILPMQRGDFEGIFKEMGDRPVTIRLLDPPLHEFIPHDAKGQEEVAKVLGVSPDEVKSRVAGLKEFNPMLGHRGCRLGITYPEIYEMQVRAIMEAACNVAAQTGKALVPEIMIPLVGYVKELASLKEKCEVVIQEVLKEKKSNLTYLIGTMIELPRAALTADVIAKEAQFFSFGTNDLTQTALGISRDDAGVFLTEYVAKGLIEKDPFVSIDVEGVGQLIKMAVEKGRKARPGIKLGICGEHGGDPASIMFCQQVGLDYVSCSPFRVPIARLAAAQAALSGGKKGSSSTA
ncbi:MAG: pyruvate, phosphate dikinase [Magnetococcales bacterium]|nr:pyruvate, phosphate dikinase [Magnetococcales bacterium]